MRKALIILLTAVLLFATSCNKSTDTPQQSPDVNKENISFYLTAKDNLNPIIADTENDVAVFSMIYDSLIYLERDMTITPQLAKSCTVSEDMMSISFVLRDDVLWHDGEKFTAEDVKYTIDAIKGTGEYSIYFDSLTTVADVIIVDDYNFTLKLSAPYARIVNLLDFPIIPAHCPSIDKTPMGTGKYKFLEKYKADSIVLTKNNLWPLGELPIEEKINIRILGNSSDEFTLFKTGEIDILNVSASQISNFGLADKSKYVQYLTPKYEFLGFNLNNKVFADSAVRKAVSAAINRDEIVKTAYLGLGNSTNSPIPPTSYFYNLDADKAGFSIEEAKTLLKDAGWSDITGDGVLEKNIDGVLYTLESSLLVNSENPLRVTAAEKICEMLSAVGFKVYKNSVDWETYYQRINSDEFGIFIGGIEFSPSFDYSFFLSSWAVENGQNFMNYASQDMDAAISKTHTAVSMDECKNAYLEFQYVFTRDLPATGILFQNSSIVYQNDISGAIEACFSKPYKDISRWRREK